MADDVTGTSASTGLANVVFRRNCVFDAVQSDLNRVLGIAGNSIHFTVMGTA